MAAGAVERKLAAIMFADVAGFSRLMERNESRTFERLSKLREEVANVLVEAHGGRIIKTTGDGFLAEFSSANAAVKCGIAIQRSAVAREADSVRVVQEAGARRPVHCTALGKVLLAWLPPAESAAIVAKLTLQKSTPKTIVSRSQFERELRNVRAAGFAIDDEEFIADVRCIAVPVFDDTGAVAAALSAIGPKHRMTHQKLRACRSLVLKCAAELSERLGFGSRS